MSKFKKHAGILLLMALPVAAFVTACGGGGGGGSASGSGSGSGSAGGGAPSASGITTISPRFAYVTNSGSGTVSEYTVDATTGRWYSWGSGLSTGTNPQSVTVDPSGKFAYVANYGSNSVSAYMINASTGALTPIVCGAGCSGTAFTAGTNPQTVTSAATPYPSTRSEPPEP